MPAGPPGAPGTRPRRLARLRPLPQGEIAGVALPLVDVDPRAGQEVLEVLSREPAVGREALDLEVHVSVDGIRHPRAHQPLDQVHHPVGLARRRDDVRRRAGLRVGSEDPQGGHVPLVGGDESLGEVGGRDPDLSGPRDDLVLDVGEVPDEANPVPPEAQMAPDHVEDEGAPGVTDVGDVVGGDAADVHGDLDRLPSRGGLEGDEGLLQPGQRVVDSEAHERPPGVLKTFETGRDRGGIPPLVARGPVTPERRRERPRGRRSLPAGRAPRDPRPASP